MPIVYHVVIHIYAGVEALHEMTDHANEHHHDEHSMIWLWVGTIGA